MGCVNALWALCSWLCLFVIPFTLFPLVLACRGLPACARQGTLQDTRYHRYSQRVEATLPELQVREHCCDNSSCGRHALNQRVSDSPCVSSCQAAYMRKSAYLLATVYITNLHYFQIINTSNHSVSQSNKYENKKTIIYSMPDNCCFTLKRIHRGKSNQSSHKNSPSESSSSRRCIKPFQIPKKLRSCSLR